MKFDQMNELTCEELSGSTSEDSCESMWEESSVLKCEELSASMG